MKIFLTGSNGFIGSNFLKKALSHSHEVIALRRSKAKPKVQLPREPIWIEDNLEGDFSKYLKGCDVLVHLAAYGVNPKFNSWADAFRWNFNASINLLFQAEKAGVKRIIIAGSCSEYGKSAERYEYIPPEAPLEPINAYGASKAAFSIAAISFAFQYKIQLAILRLFHIYGDGEHEERLWPSLKKAALAGEDFEMTLGEQVRDFTPVDYAVEQLINFATTNDLLDGFPVVKNIGIGKPISTKCFAKNQWMKLGAKGKLKIGKISYRDNEIMRYVPQI